MVSWFNPPFLLTHRITQCPFSTAWAQNQCDVPQNRALSLNTIFFFNTVHPFVCCVIPHACTAPFHDNKVLLTSNIKILPMNNLLVYSLLYPLIPILGTIYSEVNQTRKTWEWMNLSTRLPILVKGHRIPQRKLPVSLLSSSPNQQVTPQLRWLLDRVCNVESNSEQ